MLTWQQKFRRIFSLLWYGHAGFVVRWQEDRVWKWEYVGFDFQEADHLACKRHGLVVDLLTGQVRDDFVCTGAARRYGPRLYITRVSYLRK